MPTRNLERDPNGKKGIFIMRHNVIDSSARKLNEGTTTLRQVREDLCRCGWFAYLPTDRQALDLLNEYTVEDFDEIKVAERELRTMLEPLGLSLVWEMDGTYQIYNQNGKIVAPAEFFDEVVEDYGDDAVVMANEVQDEILTSERFDDLYLVLC